MVVVSHFRQMDRNAIDNLLAMRFSKNKDEYYNYNFGSGGLFTFTITTTTTDTATATIAIFIQRFVNDHHHIVAS